MPRPQRGSHRRRPGWRRGRRRRAAPERRAAERRAGRRGASGWGNRSRFQRTGCRSAGDTALVRPQCAFESGAGHGRRDTTRASDVCGCLGCARRGRATWVTLAFESKSASPTIGPPGRRRITPPMSRPGEPQHASGRGWRESAGKSLEELCATDQPHSRDAVVSVCPSVASPRPPWSTGRPRPVWVAPSSRRWPGALRAWEAFPAVPAQCRRRPQLLLSRRDVTHGAPVCRECCRVEGGFAGVMRHR